MVDTTAPPTRARFVRDSWSTQWDIGHWPESSGQLVDRGASDQDPSRPGELVDNAGPRTRARVTRANLWTLMALGHVPETPDIAGRTLMHSDPGANGPGEPFDTGGPQAWARFHRDS